MPGNRKLKDVLLWQRVLSHIFPIKIRKVSSPVNPILELYLNKGRWQLATVDALYSDSIYYRPLVLAFKELKHVLPSLKKVLVLGTGLGSAVQILASKNHYPKYTLVDYDKQILEWAIELMDESLLPYINPVCDDAKKYMDKNEEHFNLIIIDIFESRIVPSFVTERAFLEQCRKSLLPGGHVVINYMIIDDAKWQADKQNITSVYTNTKEIAIGVNRVFIATV